MATAVGGVAAGLAAWGKFGPELITRRLAGPGVLGGSEVGACRVRFPHSVAAQIYCELPLTLLARLPQVCCLASAYPPPPPHTHTHMHTHTVAPWKDLLPPVLGVLARQGSFPHTRGVVRNYTHPSVGQLPLYLPANPASPTPQKTTLSHVRVRTCNPYVRLFLLVLA